jgi:hypothetical protein
LPWREVEGEDWGWSKGGAAGGCRGIGSSADHNWVSAVWWHGEVFVLLNFSSGGIRMKNSKKMRNTYCWFYYVLVYNSVIMLNIRLMLTLCFHFIILSDCFRVGEILMNAARSVEHNLCQSNF